MNPRHEMILSCLNKRGYLTREQLRILNDLKSKRNANRILQLLKPYISSFREGNDVIYYLSKEGREQIGSEIVRKKTPQAYHHVMRNWFYIFASQPQQWQNEMKVGGKVIADAIFKKGGKWHLLEVDNQNAMSANKVKIAKYKALYESGAFQNHKDYGYFPTLLWVTRSEARQKKLLELCKDIPCNAFCLEDII
ncbi:phage protein [Fictibacillus macauensis ZFHKF-1]|uniref:Phage protein n=1 Tax=Fictibacillus macauensis ZFHKF-1 TaxID=1196324 RepID=I8UG61_9BACL|nr:replication-relaxation family protein [Fictibacillus macauensis]EIT85890.1 phage protein [Fictibacillus macauensis ZFHKF-1]